MQIFHMLVRIMRFGRDTSGTLSTHTYDAPGLREGDDAVLTPRADWERVMDRLGTVEALAARVRDLERNNVTDTQLGLYQAKLRAELAARIDTVTNRLAELTHRQEGAETRADELDAAVSATRRSLSELDEVLHLMRAEDVERQSTLTREDFAVHFKIRDRLDTLYTQRLESLISTRTTAENPVDRVLRRAELARLMCLALFGPVDGTWRGPDLDELARIATADDHVPLAPDQRKLLQRVGAEAADLHRTITGSGYDGHFDFAVPTGTPASPPDHVLWTGCEAGRPVAFVVCPGYTAHGRQLLAPTVYTAAVPGYEGG
ncbi:hypothetical protein ACWDR3_00660 [Streptomyces sp. NPDC001002]